MDFHVVIPARHASSRLPGKPLLKIGSATMIEHVWRRARASGASSVVIASDDARVMDTAQAFGADTEWTRDDHPSGTDRLAEVVARRGWGDDTIVVNVQGDEPLLPSSVIDQLAENLARHPVARMATLAEPLTDADSLWNPNVVKVVQRADGCALYFSRAPVPWAREAFAEQAGRAWLPTDALGQWRRHLGIYAYRAGLLREFVHWPPAPLEQLEMLEQLRVLHAGVAIHVADACAPVPGGVDTRADLERVRAIWGSP